MRIVAAPVLLFAFFNICLLALGIGWLAKNFCAENFDPNQQVFEHLEL